MVDFTKLMSPEERERYFERTARWQEQVQEFDRLDNQELAERLEIYIANSENYAAKVPRGEPVYDSVLWHVLLPLMARRLRMQLSHYIFTKLPDDAEQDQT